MSKNEWSVNRVTICQDHCRDRYRMGQVKGIFLSMLLMLSLPSPSIAAETVEEKNNKWVKSSQALGLEVSIFPRSGRYRIGDYHEWIVSVQDKLGDAVEDANLFIAGGMRQHGHGLPSQPSVSRYLGQGKYLVEGVLFNMSGMWTLSVSIKTEKWYDSVSFDIELEYS